MAGRGSPYGRARTRERSRLRSFLNQSGVCSTISLAFCVTKIQERGAQGNEKFESTTFFPSLGLVLFPLFHITHESTFQITWQNHQNLRICFPISSFCTLLLVGKCNCFCFSRQNSWYHPLRKMPRKKLKYSVSQPAVYLKASDL